jgi:LmbE family N-acetylglucosaminyl deacetylase
MNNCKPAYLLAVSPHPTDFEFGVGGLAARLAIEKRDVIFVVCTNGDKGTSIGNYKPAELVKIREQEQRDAAALLKVREVIFLNHTDLELEYTSEFRKEILGLILKYRPEVVATCDPSQHYFNHPDHRITGQVVLDAVWPYAMSVNTYPELRESGNEFHRVNEVLLWGTSDPNYRIDISDVFETKIAALQCHKSQIGDPILPDFNRRFREMFKNAAKGENYAIAEAFHRLEVSLIL